MKIKIIIGLWVVVFLILGFSFAHSQSTSIPNAIADQGVTDAKNHMDNDITSITLNNNDTSNKQADLQARQQAIIALASQSTPLQSAVDLCNSNPSAYCPGWGEPILSTNVNWDAVASLRASGVNWGDVKAQMTGINWPAVAQINGLNWENISIEGINWYNWPNAETTGENWSQFINNGWN